MPLAGAGQHYIWQTVRPGVIAGTGQAQPGPTLALDTARPPSCCPTQPSFTTSAPPSAWSLSCLVGQSGAMWPAHVTGTHTHILVQGGMVGFSFGARRKTLHGRSARDTPLKYSYTADVTGPYSALHDLYLGPHRALPLPPRYVCLRAENAVSGAADLKLPLSALRVSTSPATRLASTTLNTLCCIAFGQGRPTLHLATTTCPGQTVRPGVIARTGQAQPGPALALDTARPPS